jgi:hypothetical protein
MVQSGDDYREKNKIRLQRFYERHKKQGKKRLSALVTDEAYQLLTDKKEHTGASMSTLVDRAVILAYGGQGIPDIDDTALDESKDTPSADTDMDKVNIYVNDNDKESISVDTGINGLVESTGKDQIDDQGKNEPEEKEPVTATDDQEPDIIPDCTGRAITVEERDQILIKVAEAMPGRKYAQDRAALLNRKGVPLLGPRKNKGEWTTKKFKDVLWRAKERLGIK